MSEEYRQKAVEEGIPTTCLTPHGPAKARSSMARSEATARQSRQTQVDRARSRGGRRSRIDWRRSAEESALKLEFMGERIKEGGDGGEASGQESGAKRSVFSCSSSLQQHAMYVDHSITIGSKIFVWTVRWFVGIGSRKRISAESFSAELCGVVLYRAVQSF